MSICGFTVEAAGVHVWYTDGTWLREGVDGHRPGDLCVSRGDSGGAVLTTYEDGVAAKGVLSGMFDNAWNCDTFFTDIQHPVQALPGGVSYVP